VSGIRTIGPLEIFAPLPPIPYVVGGIFITPGPPTLLGGYGFCGKTVTAQSIALAVASGLDLWGVFGVKQGKVLHLDYEQGERLTRERYQRLAVGAGVDPTKLGSDVLRLAALPTTYLDSEDAFEVLSATFDGYALVVIDSLRASMPSVDENSSEVRRHLDMLTRISERTGCAVLIIHHARKTGSDDKPGDPKMVLRGSSAIFDACGNVFAMAAEKGRPTRVSHLKERTRGIPIEDFGLQIVDVLIGNDPRAGLRVVHLEPEQLDRGPSTAGTAALSKDCDRLVTFLASHGGKFLGSKSALWGAIGMNRSAFFKAISVVESDKRVTVLTPSKNNDRTGTEIILNSVGCT
jgi:hypothetical protein